MDNKAINQFLDEITSISALKPNYVTDKEVLADSIYRILTPSWIRFGSIDEGIKEFLQGQISTLVNANEPIKIINAFGGFKNPRLDSAPHIDYSEVFHLSFFISSLVLKICEIYEPGAVLEYSGDAHIVTYVDNLPKASVETYLDDFNQLLGAFSPMLPGNGKLSQKHFLEFYDYDELVTEVEKRIVDKDLNSKENRELIEKYYDRAKSNFVVKGEKDYSDLSEAELKDLIELSVVKTYKWYDVDFEKRGDYFGSGVPTCNLKGFPETYCTRSVRHQPAPPFWVSKGVILNKGGDLSPIILHSEKYLEVSEGLGSVEVENPILDIPTLKTIQILKE